MDIASEIVRYVSFAVFGGAAGYVFKNHDYKDLITLIIVLSRIFKKSGSFISTGIEYELRKNFIFMLPGRVRDKVIAINIVPMVKTLVKKFCNYIFNGNILKISIIELSFLWLILSASNRTSLFTITAVKVIIPFNADKNILMTYLKNIIEMFLELPAVVIAALTYYLFKNIESALLIFGICSLLMVIGLLYVSEAFFSRYRNK